MAAETGVQTYTFRKFSVEECVEKAAELGLEAIELWPGHLPEDSPRERLEEVKGLIDAKGLRVCGAGQFKIGPDRAKTEAALDYAELFGADYLTITLDPADKQTMEHLVSAAEERGILLGVHNHGPKDRFSEPETVRDAVKDYPDILGACVDTGHYLRSGRSPEEAVEILGVRVHGVHLKDFLDEKTEVEPGKGKLSFPSFLEALKRHARFGSAFTLEYEANPEDPMPSMKSAVANLKEALKAW
jgi:sugar phosphate isomerase/epimerase